MKIRCLVVDDEPIARQILEQYCALLPELTIVASCSNALDAKKFVNEGIHIIFLDINMPVLDGLSFIKTMRQPPQIILTTAYKEYAHLAFDLAVCDYLLKPFDFARFMIAIDKAKDKLSISQKSVEKETEPKHTFIKSDGKIFRVSFDEVMYVEADGNNVKIVTDTTVLKPAVTISSLEDVFPKLLFVRSHRSFLINKSRISHIDGNRVFIGSKEIPIGSNYRDSFLRAIGIR